MHPGSIKYVMAACLLQSTAAPSADSVDFFARRASRLLAMAKGVLFLGGRFPRAVRRFY